MEKVWLKNYQEGIPAEISLPNDATLVQLLENSNEKFKDKPSFSCMGKTLSYGDLAKASEKIGAYLTGVLKLKKGDRVAIMMPNILQYPVIVHAILRAGLVGVNINPLYTSRELEHQLKDSQACAIFIVENFAHVLEKVIGKTSVKHVVVTSLGESLGLVKSTLVNFVVRHVKKMVPEFNLPGSVSFTQALKKGSQVKFKQYVVTGDDIAFLQYTGGTTGISKGAILTHRNMLSNIEQAYQWLSSHITVGEEIIITALPLYHIFALTANCLVFTKVGAHNILITNPRDIPGFVKILKKYPYTAFTGVNTLFNALLHNSDFLKLDFSTLRFALGGGMAVQKSVAEEWKKTTKVPIIQAYGLTETCPAVCINPLTIEDFTGSIGLPIPSTDISIRDEENLELGFNEPGELCVKGPQVMKGYWQRKEETQSTFTEDGWLKTGDIAQIDEQGYVYIVDRKKDMILVSGFNVYPNEVEEVASSHPGIVEAAAIGIPDERTGELVKLFVVKKDQNLTSDDVIAHCRSGLTAYKVPKKIEFREELPKTNVGKVLRRALKE